MYQQSASKMYAQIDVESEILNASPYQLIQILFNGALSALRRALILMEQGNIAGKGENISKAINIIGNGLKQGLDKEKGEELAENLALLYDHISYPHLVPRMFSLFQKWYGMRIGNRRSESDR